MTNRSDKRSEQTGNPRSNRLFTDPFAEPINRGLDVTDFINRLFTGIFVNRQRTVTH